MQKYSVLIRFSLLITIICFNACQKSDPLQPIDPESPVVCDDAWGGDVTEFLIAFYDPFEFILYYDPDYATAALDDLDMEGSTSEQTAAMEVFDSHGEASIQQVWLEPIEHAGLVQMALKISALYDYQFLCNVGVAIPAPSRELREKICSFEDQGDEVCTDEGEKSVKTIYRNRAYCERGDGTCKEWDLLWYTEYFYDKKKCEGGIEQIIEHKAYQCKK